MRKNLLFLFFATTFTSSFGQQKLFVVDEIAFAIDSTISNKNAAYINSLFDFDKLFNKIIETPKNTKHKAFNKGYILGLKKEFDFGKLLVKEVTNGAYYDYIKRYIDQDGNERLIFRLFGDDGINYHDYLLNEINGDFKIVDVYIYLTGEYITETLHKLYLNTKNGTVNKLSFYKLRIANQLKERGKIKQALIEYNKIPKRLRNTKVFLLSYISIVENLDDDLYEKALQQLENLYTNKASFNLNAIDLYYSKKLYDKALNSIEELNLSVGQDDFLDLFRASLYFEKGDYDKTIYYYKRLISNYPNYLETYDLLLSLLVSEKRYQEVLPVLDLVITNLEITRPAVKALVKEDYPLFYKSKIFKKWYKNK